MSEVRDVGLPSARGRDDDQSGLACDFRRRLLSLDARLSAATGGGEPYPHLFGCLSDAFRAASICAWYWSRADDSIEYLPSDGGDLFGPGPGELPRCGADMLAGVHAQDRLILLRTVGHARRAARSYELQYRLVDGRGVTHIMQAAGRPVIDAKGRHIGDVGTWRNVTTLMQSENARRLVEERYALAVKGSNDGIWDWAIERDQVYFSPRLKDILGLPLGDDLLSSRQVLDMVHPADRAGYSAALRKHLRGATHYFKCEVRMVRPDGRYRWIFGRGLALRARSGRAYRMAGSVSDVTERKETERQLVQAQKMEAVGQLTGGLAHDFNNVLGVVLGNLDLVREAVSGDAGLAGHLDSAIGAAERGASLTQRLLTFSRKRNLEPEVIDVGRVILDMLDLLRRTLGETIEIEIESQNEPWLCRADRAQLESAILNLAINARDAMPNGGTLRIETANQHLDPSQARSRPFGAGDHLRLTITDSGIGMPPDAVERVFEPFFTTKGVGKGTGLGLAMVQGFVQQSGGHIWIRSAPGRGTSVEILLPRAGPDAAMPRQAGGDPPPAPSSRVTNARDPS